MMCSSRRTSTSEGVDAAQNFSVNRHAESRGKKTAMYTNIIKRIGYMCSCRSSRLKPTSPRNVLQSLWLAVVLSIFAAYVFV